MKRGKGCFSRKCFTTRTIRAIGIPIYNINNPSRIIPMAGRTSPECHSSIRKDLIRRKFIFVGPHNSDIRISGSQTIKSRKQFSVVTIRTISIPVYDLFNRSIIVAMTNRTSPDSIITIYKCFVC